MSSTHACTQFSVLNDPTCRLTFFQISNDQIQRKQRYDLERGLEMGSVVQCGNVVGGKQLYMFKTGVCRLVTVLNPGDGVVWGQIQKKDRQSKTNLLFYKVPRRQIE